jgi:hypothetical protein
MEAVSIYILGQDMVVSGQRFFLFILLSITQKLVYVITNCLNTNTGLQSTTTEVQDSTLGYRAVEKYKY